jgi:hypothetical protein
VLLLLLLLLLLLPLLLLLLPLLLLLLLLLLASCRTCADGPCSSVPGRKTGKGSARCRTPSTPGHAAPSVRPSPRRAGHPSEEPCSATASMELLPQPLGLLPPPLLLPPLLLLLHLIQELELLLPLLHYLVQVLELQPAAASLPQLLALPLPLGLLQQQPS